ncbi:PLP-dependent aminotransferase family protein [Parasedimentitalea marina]|uniref:PLP-dependent aminotransferase family protein n=1 Tax=Parasedimentitalea marina TaxID=2483033 RepID=A0A3T0MXW3_9RHOB|nr:PLP-dependent aminotransferase family protein [Parasedimentitalea marina]AZV76598.1 PLP-dependent aminotransferase family protein [Parasedimentitalea marina]
MSLTQSFASRASRMTASEIRELLKLLDKPGLISFAGGIPDPALFPAQEFAAAFARGLAPEQQAQSLQYSISEGYLPLREWIAGEMAKIGVPCTVDNILITSGSQQALDYLGKLFLSPGDTALVGWPTYLGALAAFNAYEPRYDQLSVSGNRTAASYVAGAEAEGGRVKLAYLSADFANPTGETLGQQGREALLDMTEELECALIEDAAYQALRYDGEAVPPILATEIARRGSIEDCRTIYCGSFSKTLSPGLRLGWVVAAKPVISQLVLMKQAADLHTATLNQIAVHDVASRVFDSHVETIRTAYRQRRDVMLDALSAHMPDGVTWTRPEGGMFIWLTLPAGLNGADLLERSIDSVGVAFVPGSAFFADKSGENTIRLSFSCSDEAQINEGIMRLGQVIRGA